jgi:DNA-directed RNA polymerase specialized sigma24 family protein
MFRQSSGDEYDTSSEGGRRYLFGIAHYEFHDTLDEQGRMHQFVVEAGEEEEEPRVYETDPPTMYELMARYLAGEYEKEEYEMERSPAQEALLDALELATARARSGDTGFTFDDLEEIDYDDEPFEDEEEDGEDEDRP